MRTDLKEEDSLADRQTSAGSVCPIQLCPRVCAVYEPRLKLALALQIRTKIILVTMTLCHAKEGAK